MSTKPFRDLNLKTRNFLITKPKKVATIVKSAINNKKEVIYINNFWRLIMLIIKIIPEKIFKRFSF